MPGSASTDSDSGSARPCPASPSSSSSRLHKLVRESDEEELKPLIVTSPNKSKPRQRAATTPEVLELSSGDDSDVTVQLIALREQQQARDAKLAAARERAKAARKLILEAVPDAELAFLQKTYAQCGGDANKCVEVVLNTNYPLRGGGWKHGRAPRDDEAGSGDEGDGRRERAGKDKKRKAGPSAPKDKGKQVKLKVAKGGDKDKDKVKPKAAPQGKMRAAPSDDDEDEVDQLASVTDDEDGDDDASGDEGKDEVVYSEADALEEEEWWLSLTEHPPGGDRYEKAALKQLLRDWDDVHQAQIRSLFERHERLYAPTWMALNRRSQSDELIKLLGGKRDCDYIHKADGTLKKRDAGPKSVLLVKERAWLSTYVDIGGCKRKAARTAPALVPDDDDAASRKKKKKESREDRRARTKAPAASGSGSGSGSSQPRNKKRVRVESPVPGDDEQALLDECDNHNAEGWGPVGAAATFNKHRRDGGAFGRRFGGRRAYGVKEEDAVEAFTGRGFRLGDD